jgi:integrase
MLKLRGKWWSYRKRVPNHLRPLFQGRREIVVSLKTQDEGEARIRVLSIAHETEKAIQRARERHRELVVDPAAMAAAWKQDILRQDHEDRVERVRTDESLEAEIDALESAVVDNRSALQKGDTKPVLGILREVLERHKITLTPSVERQLAHALLRERADALELALQRALGQWRDEPVAPVSPLVSAVVEAYLKERKPAPKTVLAVRAAFQRFTESHQQTISGLTKDHVRTFRSRLLDSGQARNTIRKHLGMVSTVLRYAVRVGLIETSPAQGMAFLAQRSDHEPSEEARQPFSLDAVKAFFAGPIKPKSTAWWVSLILFHSGMRLEEVGGLRGRDVQDRDGVVGFSIQPGVGRRLKSRAATRFVPCHRVLLDAGIVALARSRGEDWLFTLTADRHGIRSTNLSKWFGRYLRRLKLDQGGAVVMHSTRHTCIRLMRDAGVQENVIAAVVGHAHPTQTAQYGRGFAPRVLHEAIETIRY